MKSKNKRILYLLLSALSLCTFGIMYTWTVFSTSIINDIGISASQFSLVFSICLIVYSLGGVFGGLLYAKLPYKVMSIIFAVLVGVGLFLTSLSHSLFGLILFFGIIFPFSGGYLYKTLLAAIISWYDDKPGFASGAVLTGIGLSAFVFNVPTAMTINAYGWRTTMQILSLIAFVVTFITVITVVPKTKVVKKINSGYNPISIIKNPRFYLYYPIAVLTLACCLTISGNGTLIANSFVNDNVLAARATMLLSIFNASSRILFGYIFDKKGRKTAQLLSLTIFTSAIILLYFALNNSSFILLLFSYALIGVSFGSLTSTVSVYTMLAFGKEHYSENYSIVGTFVMLASLFGSFMFSLLLSLLGNPVKAIGFVYVYLIIIIIFQFFLEQKFKNEIN